jgi:integrase
MGRKIERLSAIEVAKLKQPGYHADGAGLYLQVSPAGTKSWLLRFTLRGKAREMGLGPLHTVSLAEARQKARAARQQLLEGIDPLDARETSRQAEALERGRSMTFDACAQAYVRLRSMKWRSAKHAAQWTSTLTTYASPVFGALPVAAIDAPLIVRVLEPLWLDKPETASRLRGRIEAVLNYAVAAKWRPPGENPARWRGHLEIMLPSRSRRVEHHAALPWREIGAFMADLRGREGISARALEYAILTAARSGEVRGATWAEIDMAAKLWTVPEGRMKAGKEHRIPLSKQAVELLSALPRVGDLVFPGSKMEKPLSDMSLTAVLRRMERGDLTAHGFRSTFRDWAAESAVGHSFGREAAEHALAHKLPDKVEAAYRRSDLLDRRAGLMQGWADACSTPSTSATVVPLRAAAG